MESVREEAPEGNIIRKGDAGEIVYTNPNRPYAATGNTPEKEACIHSGLQVGYTAADRPAWIEEGNRRTEFTYNAQFDRVRMRMAKRERRYTQGLTSEGTMKPIATAAERRKGYM